MWQEDICNALINGKLFRVILVQPQEIAAVVKEQRELDMNCDFSGNNNIRSRFFEFLWRPF